MSTTPVTIWWIRRDLRLADNAPLTAALADGATVVPLWVDDPALLASPAHRAAEKRRAFLHAGLAALAADLAERGSRLVVRRGAPAEVLAALMREIGAARVFAEADYSPYARLRDAEVTRRVPLTLLPGVTVHPPDAFETTQGKPYTVFTPYYKAWKTAVTPPTKRDLLRSPRALPAPPDVAGDSLPEVTPPAAFPAGEAEARRRLTRFIRARTGAVERYDEHRDRVDLNGTSTLSPYLRFGMLSARAAAVAAIDAGGIDEPKSGPGIWLSELVWREFYVSILHHHPRVLGEAFDHRLRRIAWRNDRTELEAWQRGRTGYPIVDAAMRQLAATGWMHNRARMIVASFLVKDLLIDWRHGEQWFMQHLVDGDPAANNGGWQWTAGTGTDAAPYFRVFNPGRQAARADPTGAYVRRWVPELAALPNGIIHEPWSRAPLELEGYGVQLDRDYPVPIVDHAAARTRALAAYKTARAES